MAVAKKCDVCGKFYEGTPENHFQYDEDGQVYLVNSLRLGNWNAKDKNWDSIVSAYDICKDCGKQITQFVMDLGGDNLVTRKKIKPAPRGIKKGYSDPEPTTDEIKEEE